MIKKVLIVALLATFGSSCTVLKEYDKMNINDPDMTLQDKQCDRNVSTMHSYREAAVGANGGRTGGGCGCN
ncbi:DUF4266 domain-containing protein [Maribacter ulvicola]|uniref:DUF4266 domain-containing protein n=1 Tax=Maribacter ulvicola TaxID=228959 RepID=A0A1N7A286_9FLAO|nr:DUF4266 domain-containing protein [Maribacter ulvicola]SIR33126.1 protein of unknown function [Maribacter ulvicola]